MKKSSVFNSKILPVIKNKYVITILAFLLWMAIFDENNFVAQYKTRQKLKDLEKDKKYYTTEIANNKENLNELMSSMDNLEKFAREKYLMKRDNEDIFVFVEEEKK
ncbi:MAG: septum formation initiator family protein [Bacteroidia bacterium]